MPLRVLIVEDSREDALLVVREIARAGYEPVHERVETAAALTAALDAHAWDVVISDSGLPHFSGAAALALVRSRRADLPFIIVSGTVGEETAAAAMRAGAQDYMMKGNLSRLVPAIERELAGLRQTELGRTQKLDAIGRLAAGVGHDFSNLLTAILGGADLMLETLPADAPQREDAQAVRDAARRAVALTRQLLAFSRQQALSPERLDLNAVVTELNQRLLGLAGTRVTLRTQLAADLGPVYADFSQIELVIVSLAANACDAMPEGGTLTIRTANVHPPGTHVLLAVTDTGSGMDADTQARLFEPFFTTKPVGKGTGLGLATVYGIVKQTGGVIEVESEPGRGTTFNIHLPRAIP